MYKRQAYTNALVSGVIYDAEGKRVDSEDGSTYMLYMTEADITDDDGIEIVIPEGTEVIVNRSGSVKKSGTVEVDGVDSVSYTHLDVYKRQEESCQYLSQIRREGARELSEKIYQALQDLNFLNVSFTIEIARLPYFTANGYDEAEFKISANPGEPARPLKEVASGGELSRIMLAIKAVLADTDQMPTLSFDESDTGISGRTAQKEMCIRDRP